MGDAASFDTEGGSPGGLPDQAGGGGGGGGGAGKGFSPAGASSIAALGLSAFSSIQKGAATKAADDFQASKAERAADFGRLQAGLTDTVMRENLNTTISNIDVIRAAARADPTSPTGAAIETRNKMLSDRSRTAALLNINSQVAEDEASASYLRKAGDYAVSQSYLDAGIKVGGAVAKAFI